MGDIYLRVTEVGKCQRPRYYKAQGYKPLSPHYYSTRGRISHALIEHELSGDRGDISYVVEQQLDSAEVPEHGRQELRDMTKTLHDRFHFWKQNTSLIEEGEPITIETRMAREVVPGVFLTGQPDLLTDKGSLLVDFKSGKRTNRKGYRQQLGAYRWLNHEKQNRLVNVFLDEKSIDKMELVHDLDKVQADMKDYWEEVDNTIEEVLLVESGQLPPAKRAYLCSFCSYNNVCRGFGGRDAE